MGIIKESERKTIIGAPFPNINRLLSKGINKPCSVPYPFINTYGCAFIKLNLIFHFGRSTISLFSRIADIFLRHINSSISTRFKFQHVKICC